MFIYVQKRISNMLFAALNYIISAFILRLKDSAEVFVLLFAKQLFFTYLYFMLIRLSPQENPIC